MCVFGGDSWGREAQHRKRRVEDLVLVSESAIDATSSPFKKLSNGQFACLVCPQNPVLDSPLMFSTHCKGWRHQAAEARLKERELSMQEGANKRMASADSLRRTAKPGTYNQKLNFPDSKPVIEQTQNCRVKSLDKESSSSRVNYGTSGSAKWHLDYRERRERELKFTAAGWKRDCHGKWYKDENVEFDSDEDDPNECLA